MIPSFQIAFFCAALVAVSAYAPLVNTGVSAVSNQQDAYGNYAYRYDIKDAATGSLNSKAEVGKVGAVAVAAPVVYSAYAAPLAYGGVVGHGGALGYGGYGRVAYGGIAAPAIAAPLAYGGVVGHGGALGLGYGGALGLGYGGVLGLGHGAGILGAGLGKVIL
ncbi:hypothetical protein CDAR_84801 [Caerostris darwini]|uniref:Uncharacterized protein n=1 Tax=Caerostris darwini TaxID=1538125 RepID=A0AAV4W6I3_9ARAC|nr:hypothetical protein CDAR_84801 [Caerostris darwini]